MNAPSHNRLYFILVYWDIRHATLSLSLFIFYLYNLNASSDNLMDL